MVQRPEILQKLSHTDNSFQKQKIENFIGKILIFLIFLVKSLIVGTRRGGSNMNTQSMFWIKNKNQRTNGPVNAHLRSKIYTNKFV